MPLDSKYRYIVALTSWPKSRSSERNRRSFMNCACATVSGEPGWTYSVDSLNTKIASGSQVEDGPHARMEALTQCLMLVTKAVSLLRRSFHQPKDELNSAVT